MNKQSKLGAVKQERKTERGTMSKNRKGPPPQKKPRTCKETWMEEVEKGIKKLFYKDAEKKEV